MNDSLEDRVRAVEDKLAIFISSPVIRPPPTPAAIAIIAKRSLPTARWISAVARARAATTRSGHW